VIDKKVVLISISGFCGTGKTTTANLFVEKLSKAVMVRGDLLMSDAALKYLEEFEKIFDMPLDVNDTYYSISKGINKGATQFGAFLELVHPFVDSEIHKIIESILVDPKKSDTEHIVIEWAALPICPIWEESDYRVMIDAPKEERNRKLYERSHPLRIPKEEYRNAGDIREEAIKKIIKDVKRINFHIYNTFDQNLVKDVQQICDSITQSKSQTKLHKKWRK